MEKYSNKHTRICSCTVMDCSNIRRVFQHKFTALPQFVWLPVARYFRNWQRDVFFHKKWFMFWTFCFFVTKHGFTLVDTLLVKIVEYGVLKPHIHCMKILWFRRHRLWVPLVSQMNRGSEVLWGEWGRDCVFSIGCNYTPFVTFLASLENKINS